MVGEVVLGEFRLLEFMLMWVLVIVSIIFVVIFFIVECCLYGLGGVCDIFFFFNFGKYIDELVALFF